MSSYRHFIVGTKRKWNLQALSSGHPPSKRVARALLFHRAYVEAYLKAKRAVFAGEELVDA